MNRWQKYKRFKAWNEPGHAHVLTYSCYKGYKLLSRDRSRQWVIEAMAQTREKLDVLLWAYVIMPEHVHVALRPRRSDARIEHIRASLKRSVSKKAKMHLVETRNEEWLGRLTVRKGRRPVFHFWQPGGGFDRNIWRERSLAAMIEYIHLNPVRRELVKSPTDWRWSSAQFWDGCGDVPLAMDGIDAVI